MTTTVTVETHDWPVSVATTQYHSFTSDQRTDYGHRNSVDFVPKNTTRQFAVSDSTSITVNELPQDATGLNHLANGVGSASVGDDLTAI